MEKLIILIGKVVTEEIPLRRYKTYFFKILENIHTRLFLNSLINIKKDQINELYPFQPKESINVYQRFLFFLPFCLSLSLSFYVVILFIPSHRRA